MSQSTTNTHVLCPVLVHLENLICSEYGFKASKDFLLHNDFLSSCSLDMMNHGRYVQSLSTTFLYIFITRKVVPESTQATTSHKDVIAIRHNPITHEEEDLR